MSTGRDHKQAAVEQWTADPCGPAVPAEEPGSRKYFEQVLAGRFEYAPWMREALDCSSTVGMDVLDVGCGQGIDLACYALAGARVTGIDLTPRHVELAQRHIAAMELAAQVQRGDAESMPFFDSTFDRVSSNGVLHHTPDISAALREIHRVLRPGGEARIIVYNRDSLHYWLHLVLVHGIARGELLRERSMKSVLSRNVEYTTVGARPLVLVYSRRGIANLMRAAGFVEVTTKVRHLRASDSYFTLALSKLFPGVERRGLLDRIGRFAGWYIVASGVRAGGWTLPRPRARHVLPHGS